MYKNEISVLLDPQYNNQEITIIFKLSIWHNKTQMIIWLIKKQYWIRIPINYDLFNLKFKNYNTK